MSTAPYAAPEPTGAAAPTDTDTLADPGLRVNGESVPLGEATPHTSLLSWLRERGLTGAKEGCAEGECGACAVLVARPAALQDQPDQSRRSEWVAINACLTPVAALDGQEVVTAEGLGTPDCLHPVQRELAESGGSQCGYCTPGFVCAMAAEFYRPGREDFDEHALSGNLCRCTGYRPIMDAAHALGAPATDDQLAARRALPPPAPRTTHLRTDDSEFIRPATLSQTLELLADHPDAVLLGGGTDLGVAINLLGARPSLIIAIDRLDELRGVEITPDEIRLGAASTLSELEQSLAGRIPLLDQLFPQFASRLIRNAATLGSNLATASPIGDAAPVLLALDATLALVGPDGERLVPLAEFFTGYRQTARQPDEVIAQIRIPLPLASTAHFHKIAKRRFDDISSVAVAFALEIDTDLHDATGTVTSARIGVGGIAATPLRAFATEAALHGMPWTEQTVAAAAAVLAGEGTPLSDHRASEAYRRAMLEQSLLKLYATTAGGRP